MKINFTGSLAQRNWDYICEECEERSVITHCVDEDMHDFSCNRCDGRLLRYIDVAPSLGAEYHDSIKSANLGWSLEGEL